MKIKRHYYLMISCPSDVVKERELLKECVDTINSERNDDVWVELVYWANDTFSNAGTPAQDSINTQIVNDSDGLIAIFNARLGTPVHSYKCGTDEEIALMLEANKHVSLLFNTKPVIDLSNPTSIDQITKLREYKEEQSKTAYYKEFYDDNSFISTAKLEIRLWLREITKSTKSSETSDGEDDNKATIIDDEKAVDCDNLVALSQIDNVEGIENTKVYDEDAGVLDCVVYITNAATELTDKLNDFNQCTNTLNEKTTLFTDKFKLAKKQNNSNAVLLLCKQYAKEIDVDRNQAASHLDKVEEKWSEIFKYMMKINTQDVSLEDKTIIQDSIISLKETLENNVPKVQYLVNVLDSIPNFQKDIKASISNLSRLYKRFNLFNSNAIENCEEIVEAFS